MTTREPISPPRPRGIVITGFMGTGKSTVAPLVAQRLGWRHIEMDAVIAARAGKSIAAIFAEDGEAAFRAMERDLCRELADQRDVVISTGGGTLMDEAVRTLMLERMLVVCLDTPEAVIARRLKHSRERPLASNWKEVYASRRAIYDSIPLHVQTDRLTPAEVAGRIIVLWNKANGIEHLLVKTPEGSYDILIGAGLLRSLGERAAEFGLTGSSAIITNRTIAPLYADMIQRQLPNAKLITVPDGEQYKTLDTVAEMYRQMVAARLDRTSAVIALGGGVIGDTAGFAAATYMRGIRLIQLPTSLLAMVDSSVGGKVGIDLPEGKNLVGAFKQPALVIIDPEVLATLPLREVRCGMAEVIKHGLLDDATLLDSIESTLTGDLSEAGLRRLLTPEFIRRAVSVKIRVVERDPFERGIRAHLNLGHTFAHAIEQTSGYSWPHGEAVAVGLILAARLSALLGRCDEALAARVERLVKLAGLPAHIGGLNPDAVLAAMATDKKWQQGRARFVVLNGIGQPDLAENVPVDIVRSVLDSLAEPLAETEN